MKGESFPQDEGRKEELATKYMGQGRISMYCELVCWLDKSFSPNSVSPISPFSLPFSTLVCLPSLASSSRAPRLLRLFNSRFFQVDDFFLHQHLRRFSVLLLLLLSIASPPTHSLTHHSPPGRSRSEQCAVSPLRPFPISAQSLIRIIHVLFARSPFFARLLPTIASSSPFLPSVSLSLSLSLSSFSHFEPNSSMTQSHGNVLNLTIDMNRIDCNLDLLRYCVSVSNEYLF